MPAGTPESVPRSDLACGRIPPTPGYAACTRTVGHDGPCAHDLVASEPTELEKIVAEMRKLGVTEYSGGGIRVVLGSPGMPPQDEKSEDEQQRIRDDREKRELMRKRRILLGASARIGPPDGDIK